MNSQEIEERAARLHKESIIIDGLTYAAATGSEVSYFDRILEAGLTAANISVCFVEDTHLEGPKRFKNWYDLFDKLSDKIIMATRASDVLRAKKEGRFAFIMGVQNADILGNDMTLLPLYERAGLRIVGLSYYRQNLLGEGCGERTNSGLSNFGIEVIEEMNRLGMIVDVSHSGDQVRTDAIKYSKDPILISHAGADALCHHTRCIRDEQLKAMAEKGGVLCVIGYSTQIEVRKDQRPTLEDFLVVIDYVVKLIGVDHVGIGLDLSPFRTLEGYTKWAKLHPDIAPKGGFYERHMFTNKDGVDDVTRYPDITKGLVARGYSDEDIQKILGLNVLRVFREVCGD